MNIYIAVISHGHSDLINQLACLPLLSKEYQVVIKSNKSKDHFDSWIESPNLYWIDDQYGCGFGRNNNIVFEYCRSELRMTEEDYFIVLNPDVIIESKEIERLIDHMSVGGVKLSAINLLKDRNKMIYDQSIRKFPTLLQFVKSFLGLGNSSILDKSSLISSSKVDWAAGSFLAFKSGHYAKLGGFDENYFMYCEDIDICYRSYLSGERVTYYPEISALHLAKHANRELFSMHFYWHITSALRFLLTKVGLTKKKSSLLE
ncbi:glycosyltransferase family 2 protein [Vibrio sinensis]|uniref:Glycosyltransferase family 2 protein n=2 Tax=Vibrio sinensis TaxID=2302434 RepID=A0A3A6QMA5_9VIBR|nr:glycosyltransferase family 2 protein [Vibrio sinensis]RJX72368.1 glycosyltransferase family 2 protein [Vibrio sinensis]